MTVPKIEGARVTYVAYDEVPGPRPAPARPVREHVAADHMSFLNADGTRSRICICVCDTCWPVTDRRGRVCPDWNDDTEGV